MGSEETPDAAQGNREPVDCPGEGLPSGNDIGDETVGNRLDFILQPKLSLFEPRQLELVRRTGRLKCPDLLVEPPMLAPQ